MDKTRGFHRLRYEYGLWPLWRLDKNLGYLLKSFFHRQQHFSSAEAAHWQKMSRYVQGWCQPPVVDSEALRISAVGDLMWIRSGWASPFSTGVQNSLKDADLLIANMETPICDDRPVKKWIYDTLIYNAPASYLAPWLSVNQQADIVLNLCNNHALDQGDTGLGQTRETILASSPRFACLGGLFAGDDLCLREIKGHKIGLLSSTFTINRFGQPKTPLPAGVPIHAFGHPHQEPDWPAIGRQVDTLRQQGATLIILSPHWGFEYEYWPDPLQRKHAHRLIELGIDIILGHSPHVLQPIELVSINQYDPGCPIQLRRPGKAGMGLIAYSLGNFLSVMPTQGCRTAGILQINMNQGQLTSIHWVPTYTLRARGQSWLDTTVQLTTELAQPPLDKSAIHQPRSTDEPCDTRTR